MAQPESNERKWVLLLCLLAAMHVFVFSAAFPFFNNVDEQAHFDLVLKYSHGHIPRGLEPISTESAHYIIIYGTSEYLEAPAHFPAGQFPPPLWTQAIQTTDPRLVAAVAAWHAETSFEVSQPPLYYALAGAWWNLGRACGFTGGHLLYWLKFLNVFFISALVWLGFLAARLVFPEQPFLRLGVPALLAFFPQAAFYSIQNDVLSPLCFGAAFICLVQLLRADVPSARLGTATGLALAAVFLTKISNLPLLAVAAAVVLFKIIFLAKSGTLRPAWPAMALLVLCAGLPVAGWLAWTKYHFGDFTGATAKIAFLGWTHKPFGEWWQHPIFTPQGLWTFASGVLATFWRGEFWWHYQPLAAPWMDFIYTVSSLGFVMVALITIGSPFNGAGGRRQALWLGFGCCLAAVAFLGFLSIIYDFGACYYPSRAHPYFTSGRLMLGVLIPFSLLYLHGLDQVLQRVKSTWVRPLVLVVMILFMLITEIVTDWTAFSSQYNWFHM